MFHATRILSYSISLYFRHLHMWVASLAFLILPNSQVYYQ